MGKNSNPEARFASRGIIARGGLAWTLRMLKSRNVAGAASRWDSAQPGSSRGYEPSQQARVSHRIFRVDVEIGLWCGMRALVLAIFCSGTALGQPLSAASAASDAQGRDVRPLAALINGIVSYTRWPQPPNPIRICVLGRDDLVSHLQAGAAITNQRPITVYGVKSEAGVKNDCDVAYVSALPPENARLLLRQILAAAIVTIGEGAEFCSDGGMFCIVPGAGSAAGSDRLRFFANLDAISRSGLRVNPQVLLLSTRSRESGP